MSDKLNRDQIIKEIKKNNDLEVHTTVGLYPDGTYNINGVLKDHLVEHIEYNFRYRPGRALYLNKELIYKGSVSKKQIEIFNKMQKENPEQFTETKADKTYR